MAQWTLCKKLDIRYRIICVYLEFTHQESHLRNEPVSHCAYFEYPQPHHVRLEGFTKQCLRIPLFAPYTVLGTHSDSVHGILVGFLIYYNQKHTRTTINIQRSNSAAIEERLHCWLFNSLHELLSNPLQRDNGRVARRAGQRFKLLPLRTAIAKKRSSVKIKMHSASLRS